MDRFLSPQPHGNFVLKCTFPVAIIQKQSTSTEIVENGKQNQKALTPVFIDLDNYSAVAYKFVFGRQ